MAAARGDVGIAVGNIVGSNILNLTLILGIAALVAPIAVASTVIRREVRLAVAAVAVFAVLTWIGLAVWAGVVLTVLTAAAVCLLLRWARSGRNAEVADDAVEHTQTPAVVDVPVPPSRVPSWIEPLRAVLGLAGVLTGAQLLVVNASSIAEDFGVPQVVIGFTLVALGTSVPELVTTVPPSDAANPTSSSAICSAATFSTASPVARSSASPPVADPPSRLASSFSSPWSSPPSSPGRCCAAACD